MFSMKGFIEFIRTQGVIGLAVGFLLGGSVSKLVNALINDIINPLIGPILGFAGNLKDAYLQIGPVKLLWGDFAANLIDFAIIAAVVYYGIKGLGLDKLDKSKEKTEDKKIKSSDAVKKKIAKGAKNAPDRK